MKVKPILFTLSICAMLGCQNKENQLVTKIEVSDFVFTLQKSETNSNDTHSSFLFRIDTKTKNDITFWETTDYNQYSKKMEVLNFDMVSFFKLLNRTTGEEIIPSLVHMENTYGISSYRDFHLVFPTKIDDRSLWQLIFNDEIFETGVSRFNLPD